jgi:tripeptide aminopeptidase
MLDKDRLIKTFIELIKIPSESPNDKEFIAYVENLFTKMGAKCVKDKFGNLVAKFSAKNSETKEPIMFCCHGDTVQPGIGIEPVIEGNEIKSKGETILAGDDKGGIAEVIEMLRSAKAHPPIEVLITRCEEISPSGAEKLDYSMIDSKRAYVIDLDASNEIIIGGPTYIKFEAIFHGLITHAGLTPEKGISSIRAASEAITKLPLGAIDHETTANVGIFKGGKNVNSVPDLARIEAECRSLNHEKALKLVEEFKKVFNDVSNKHKTRLELNVVKDLKAYSVSPDSKLVKMAAREMEKLGLKPDIKPLTGGTDASHISQHGIETVGLGIGVRDVHTTDEKAIISEMVDVTKVITAIVENLA